MNETTAAITLLPAEGIELNDVRRLARRIAERLNHESYRTDHPGRARTLGRLIVLAEALDEAAFHLLNEASSYADDAVAAYAIRQWNSRGADDEQAGS